ncbi:MAG: Rrf2 family transcriptional regulator [Acidobacteriia bacterium]|nr:Rrf2 family transcriptional regulator [Methyloceanibacter sp.]MBX5470890.1 Rrf2 family transcriptional regulator [Acetobacteraceae bacterium]MCL6491279.1 Rrf2 family transcriptional regulator [Terriglobia bacterium]
MKLQKATVFALYAVLELAAAPGRQRTVVEIAEKYGISAHHLAKVLRDLGRAGIVDAVRGVGGGYRFTGNAKRLTLMDVIRLFEEPSAEADLPLPSRDGQDIAEGLRFVLAELDAQTGATLRSISLSTMLKLIARRPWESQGAATPARRAQAGRRSR